MDQLIFIVSSILIVGSCILAETCPGGQERCPDFMTCCEIASGNFGCCPFPEAKCCADQIHCCPHDMECDITHQACRKEGLQFTWQIPLSADIVELASPDETANESNNLRQFTQFIGRENRCPDDSQCHSSFTCCKMYSGKYGCCPFEEGTCCQDGFHCCPHASKCDVHGNCYSTEKNYIIKGYLLKDKKDVKFVRKVQEAMYENVVEHSDQCPDGHPCPEKFTCCIIQGHRYGCCPLTDAVCCDDGIHCCPKGTNCNTTLGTCDIQKHYVWSTATQPFIKLQFSDIPEGPQSFLEEVSDVVCPDERYHCPSHTTCCQLASGEYGCCPLEHAVCCQDKEHCCPHGYDCVEGGCEREGHYIPHFRKTPATAKDGYVNEESKHVKILEKVVCPDQHECLDGNTCCLVKSGQYGCCPLTKPRTVNREGEVCPDLISECPEGSSCCEMTSGAYGCCPLKDAVCCQDREHCCPHGYDCFAGGCEREGHYIPHFRKTPATARNEYVDEESKHVKNLEKVVCPDKYECLDGSTCCLMESGSYGCCPLTTATCCSDHIHCCPHGYKCIDDGCKTEGSGILPHFIDAITIKRNMEPRTVNREDEVCPDQISECPEGSTCCEMASGAYGCCPLEDATCCGDLEHCCPHGYWCTDDGCERNTGEPYHLPLFLHKQAVRRIFF